MEQHEQLRHMIEVGFARNDAAQAEIKGHLKELNGRVYKGEAERGIISEKVATLARAVGELACKTPATCGHLLPPTKLTDAGDDRIVRWYHVAIFVGGVVTALAAVAFLAKGAL